MEVHIYPCPFRSGWIRCDVRVEGETGRTLHVEALEAYQRVQHLDKQSGVNFRVDVPGLSLEKLREQDLKWNEELIPLHTGSTNTK